jgi:hypothetical protein
VPSDPHDLSGTWHGTYTYPANKGPATPFLATIEENGRAFSGTIIEPDIFYRQGTIEAAISGHRSGTSVDFVKSYSGGTVGYENPVDYVGRLSGDGLMITGVWSLLDFDGSFEMERDAAAEEPAMAEEAIALER